MKHPNIIISLLMCCLLQGCNSDIAGEPDKSDLLMVSFSVVVERNSIATRADETWGNYDPKDPGYDFDCNILQENFTVLLYGGDGSLAGKVGNLWATRAETPDATTFQFYGILETELDIATLNANSYKMMVFANIPTPLGETNPGDLQFAYHGMENEFPAVPMWGVATASLADLRPGKMHHFNGDAAIPLLRAMAMVRVNVKLDESQKGRNVSLESLSLNRYNPTGFVTPYNWDHVAATTDIPLASTLRIPTQTYEPEHIMATMPADASQKTSLHFYIPEIKNKNGDNELILSVAYLDGTKQQTGRIRFAPYNADGSPAPDASPWNIVRNHIYDFTITGVANDEISLNVAVKPWRTLNYEYDY